MSEREPPVVRTALVLGAGGAHGAYQAGVLRAIARQHPTLELPILTGISAGAINAAFLAAHAGDFAHAAADLSDIWLSVTPERVYDVDARTLVRDMVRWSWRLVSGGIGHTEPTRGLVDTRPLRRLLARSLPAIDGGTIVGIDENIAAGRLRAIALSATSYATGQSVTWVQGERVALWKRPHRRAEFARLSVDHVMASAAIPLFFPAVRVGEEWFGDGGIRFTAPLSPALHLGAGRILTISTHYRATEREADVSQIAGYPPPAQVLGVLSNAIFLDVIDQDILRLEMINRLLTDVPMAHRRGLRHVDILALRPSRDLGRMARTFEPRLPRAFRFLTRGLGTRRTTNADILSVIMFQQDYLQALIELGEHDADAQMDRISAFVAGQETLHRSGRAGRARA